MLSRLSSLQNLGILKFDAFFFLTVNSFAEVTALHLTNKQRGRWEKTRQEPFDCRMMIKLQQWKNCNCIVITFHNAAICASNTSVLNTYQTYLTLSDLGSSKEKCVGSLFGSPSSCKDNLKSALFLVTLHRSHSLATFHYTNTLITKRFFFHNWLK